MSRLLSFVAAAAAAAAFAGCEGDTVYEPDTIEQRINAACQSHGGVQSTPENLNPRSYAYDQRVAVPCRDGRVRVIARWLVEGDGGKAVDPSAR